MSTMNALRSAAVIRKEQQIELYSRGKMSLLKTANLHQMLSDSCAAQAIYLLEGLTALLKNTSRSALVLYMLLLVL
jgi:hypothetical protein